MERAMLLVACTVCSSTEHGGPSKKNLLDRFLARCSASSLLASLAAHAPGGPLLTCWSTLLELANARAESALKASCPLPRHSCPIGSKH